MDEKPHYALRLSGAIVSLACAFWLVRAANAAVVRSGWGAWPILFSVGATACLVAGLGLLIPRLAGFCERILTTAGRAILEFFHYG